MKSKEIISKLEAQGFEVAYGKYEYWEDVPYVKHADGNKTFIAKTYTARGSAGLDRDISFKKALQAIELKCRDINHLENVLLEQKIEKEAAELAKKYS